MCSHNVRTANVRYSGRERIQSHLRDDNQITGVFMITSITLTGVSLVERCRIAASRVVLLAWFKANIIVVDSSGMIS